MNGYIGHTGDILMNFFISYWVLKHCGHGVDEVIDKRMMEYLEEICVGKRKLNTILCSVTFCAMMTSSMFNNEILMHGVNMRLMVLWTKSVFNSCISECQNRSEIEMELIYAVKRKTIAKYLVIRIAECVNNVEINMRSKPRDYEMIKIECSFLEYIWKVINDNMFMRYCMLWNQNSFIDTKWWNILIYKMDNIIKSIENENHSTNNHFQNDYVEIKSNLTRCLRNIQSVFKLNCTNSD